MLDGAQCPVGHTSLETLQKAFLGSAYVPGTCSGFSGESRCASVRAKPPGPSWPAPCTPGSILRAWLTAWPWRDVCVSLQRSFPTRMHREAGLRLLHAGPPGRDPGRAQETVEQATCPERSRHSSGGPRPVCPMRTRSVTICGFQG